MGNPSIGYLLDKLAGLDDYSALFTIAFPDAGLNMETLGAALAAYERTLSSGNSAFDRATFGNDPTALTNSARRGRALFRGKARCVSCHTINPSFALFTDQALHNTGIGYARSMGAEHASNISVGPGATLALKPEAKFGLSEPAVNDLGRYEITQDPADRWKYRTPSLRNVALTAPYMHDGSFSTLRAVVEFYNDGGIANEGLDPLIKPLQLPHREIDDLVAFLRSLTGDNIEALARDASSQAIGDRH
ncbi:MAG: cytochrome-c peroxidase, partial [Gammaproteobacteria bacterium]